MRLKSEAITSKKQLIDSNAEYSYCGRPAQEAESFGDQLSRVESLKVKLRASVLHRSLASHS